MSKDAFKQLKAQIEKNPKQFFKENAGKPIPLPCPKCSKMALAATASGTVKCNACGTAIDSKLIVTLL